MGTTPGDEFKDNCLIPTVKKSKPHGMGMHEFIWPKRVALL